MEDQKKTKPSPEKGKPELPELETPRQPDYELYDPDYYKEDREELEEKIREMDEDPVHPSHYKGDLVMRIIEYFGFDEDAYMFNVLKYSLRFATTGNISDLEKAAWYLARKISREK